MSSKLVSILGPTAVGKTKFAIKLADNFSGEIISADSRQVYRHMDIGTGKDLTDYSVNGRSVNYHLIDIIEPSEEFNLYMFMECFNNAYMSITEKGKLPFLVGGTGMYLSSVIQKYELNTADFESRRHEELKSMDINELRNVLLKLKPDQHNITDLIDRERIVKAILIAEAGQAEVGNIELDNLVIGVKLDRDAVKKSITKRLKERLHNGMVEEIKHLVDNGISIDKLKFFGLEYKYVGMYLNGELSYNDMYQKLNGAIHKFAKRQMTWFRKMEQENVQINWFMPDEIEAASKLIDEFIKG